MSLEVKIIDHGIEHEQYFQGCGVAFTKYDVCYTGIGSNASEALEDALEQAACAGINTSDIQIEQDESVPTETELTHTDCGSDDCYAQDMYHYLSILIKLGDK